MSSSAIAVKRVANPIEHNFPYEFGHAAANTDAVVIYFCQPDLKKLSKLFLEAVIS